LYQL